ncbi:MAG: DUF2735 domain-containing protein [Methyloceanibacter sp.]
MTANTDRGSATIYQFPAGGRAGLGMRAGLGIRRAELKSVENFAAPRIAKVAAGSAFYHEDALQDAEPARKI